MPKITLADLSNLTNPNSVVSTVNSNNTIVENAIENTLSRDGSTPNQMEANIDMNSNRIVNVGAPVFSTDVLRVADLPKWTEVGGFIYVDDILGTTAAGRAMMQAASADAQNALLAAPMPAYLRKRKTFRGLGAVAGSGTDNTAILNAAFASLSAGDYIDGQSDAYRIDAAVNVPHGIIMENARFLTSNVLGNVYPLNLLGTRGTGISVSTALTLGVIPITCASTATLTVGGDVLFRQQCAWPGVVASVNPGTSVTFTIDSSKFTTSTFVSANGVLGTVSSIPNSTTIVFNPVVGSQTASFVAGPSTVFVTTPDGFAIDSVFNTWWGRVRYILSATQFTLEFAYPYGFTIPATDLFVHPMTMAKDNRFVGISNERNTGVNETHFFRADYAEGTIWQGGEIEGPFRSARLWFGCRDVTVEDVRDTGMSQDGAGYGDVFDGGCIKARLRNATNVDSRHAGSVAGTSGIEEDIKFEGYSIRGSRGAGLDAHPACRNVVFENNDIAVWNRFRASGENIEGITMQGAHMHAINNTIRGVGSPDLSSRLAYGILHQPLTREPDDSARIDGNVIRDISGAATTGITVANQKLSGTLSGLRIENNQLTMENFGGTGVLSPLGVNVETSLLGGGIEGAMITNNQIATRGTALRLSSVSGRFMEQTTVAGNVMTTVNTDVPVIDIVAGASAGINRVPINGNSLFGGSVGVSNVNGTRVEIGSIGTIAGYATAPTSGTIVGLLKGTFDLFVLAPANSTIYGFAVAIPEDVVVTEIYHKLDAGTCTIQLKSDSGNIFAPMNVTTTAGLQTLSQAPPTPAGLLTAGTSIHAEVSSVSASPSPARLKVSVRYYSRSRFS